METEKVVYLDNAATTACAPEVLAVMTEPLSGVALGGGVEGLHLARYRLKPPLI